jgi:hypothetical protein
MLEFLSMATLVRDNGSPYLVIVFRSPDGTTLAWEMSTDMALTNMLDIALCIQAMRDIEEKQKKAHGDLQYAESRAFEKG